VLCTRVHACVHMTTHVPARIYTRVRRAHAPTADLSERDAQAEHLQVHIYVYIYLCLSIYVYICSILITYT